MRIKAAIALLLVTVLAGGSALWLNANEPRKPYPKATPPPPPSPIYTPSDEKAPTAEDIELDAREHDHRLVGLIERALATRDREARETAFTFLLPELIQVAPARVVAMVADQKPGEARDLLRNEIAGQWITQDRDAAIRWMKSLDDAEEREAAYAAVRTLAPVAPWQAIYVADEFGIGRDDGYLEHLVQVWAHDNIEQVDRWIATQPEGPRVDQLRARLERVRQRTRRARG